MNQDTGRAPPWIVTAPGLARSGYIAHDPKDILKPNFDGSKGGRIGKDAFLLCLTNYAFHFAATKDKLGDSKRNARTRRLGERRGPGGAAGRGGQKKACGSHFCSRF